MPMLVPLLPAIIGAGASIAGSALSGKPKTSTQTSTTTPQWSPELQDMMSKLMAYSGESMTDPNKALQPMKTAAMDSVNRNYMDAPNQVATQMARRGYGSSGEMGNSMYKVALGRAGAMSDLESNFAQMALQKQNEGATIGQNLLQMGRGATSTGTSTGPDTSLANGLASTGGSLNNIMTMLTMSKLLKGGGSSGGGWA